MTNIQKIIIPRALDRSIFNCFKEIGEKYNILTFHVSALAFSNIGEVYFKDTPNEDFNFLINKNSILIESCSLHISGLTITYHRGGHSEPDKKSPIYDEILLQFNQQQGNLDISKKIDIIDLINNKLNAFEPGRFIKSGLTEEQNQLLSIHNSTLERLERLNEDLIQQSSTFRENLENKFNDKSIKLDEAFEQRKSELINEINLRRNELDYSDKELQEKLKAIDDRNNTHVRREIRDKMLNDVKSRINYFGVSKNTQNKRRPDSLWVLIYDFRFIDITYLCRV